MSYFYLHLISLHFFVSMRYYHKKQIWYSSLGYKECDPGLLFFGEKSCLCECIITKLWFISIFGFSSLFVYILTLLPDV